MSREIAYAWNLDREVTDRIVNRNDSLKFFVGRVVGEVLDAAEAEGFTLDDFATLKVEARSDFALAPDQIQVRASMVVAE